MMPGTAIDPPGRACFDLKASPVRKPATRRELLHALVPGKKKADQLRVDLHACVAGTSDCRICADHCPTGALAVRDGRVELACDLCQKCGACMGSCPVGAISFESFSHGRFMASLAEAASKKREDRGPGRTCLVLTCEKCLPLLKTVIRQPGADFRLVSANMPCLGALSPLALMRAWQLGFSAVICACTEPDCPNQKSAQDCGKMISALNLLAASGPGETRFAWIDARKDGRSDAIAAAFKQVWLQCEPAIGRPDASTGNEGFRAALAGIMGRILEDGEKNDPMAHLPLPFYHVRVDGDKCILCGACARTCPAKALDLKADQTRALMFSTRACIGCATCVNRCPEKAVSLERVLLPREIIHNLSLKKIEDKRIRCKNCGKPISNRSLLKKVEGRVRSLGYDFSSHSLYLCEECKRMDALFF